MSSRFSVLLWRRRSRWPPGRRAQRRPALARAADCRRGHITDADIGAIRIGARETRFEIASRAADRFTAAIAKPADRDNDVRIELFHRARRRGAQQTAIVDASRAAPRRATAAARSARQLPVPTGHAQALRPGRRARPRHAAAARVPLGRSDAERARAAGRRPYSATG